MGCVADKHSSILHNAYVLFCSQQLYSSTLGHSSNFDAPLAIHLIMYRQSSWSLFCLSVLLRDKVYDNDVWLASSQQYHHSFQTFAWGDRFPDGAVVVSFAQEVGGGSIRTLLLRTTDVKRIEQSLLKQSFHVFRRFGNEDKQIIRYYYLHSMLQNTGGSYFLIRSLMFNV